MSKGRRQAKKLAHRARRAQAKAYRQKWRDSHLAWQRHAAARALFDGLVTSPFGRVMNLPSQPGIFAPIHPSQYLATRRSFLERRWSVPC